MLCDPSDLGHCDLTMTVSDLCYLSARDILMRFAAKSLSPVDYLQTLVDRTDTVNPTINAYTETFFEDALIAAQAAKTRYAKGTARPLEGLPIAVKDAQRVAGQRTTQGSWALGHEVETQSDPMIERLMDAGAIIHARTTTPEFCLSSVCRSERWGETLNPFNLAYSPGGSSGGSAAALAAGTTPLATGTDIGGSIRIPASACGLAGYKPPHGRNPDGPPANFDRYNHCGFLGRTVSDCALGQNIVSGPHPRDHDSLRDRVVIPDRFDDRPLRIAFSMDLGYLPVDGDVRANTEAALDVFRAAGCQVKAVDLGWDARVDVAAMTWYLTMHFGRAPLWALDRYRNQMTDYAVATAEAAARLQPDEIARSWDVQHQMQQGFGAIMEDHGVFLCPTLSIGSVRADHDVLARDFKIEGRVVDPEYGWIFTHHFNMLHNCPVVSVPSGRDRNGIPTGLQIVGPTFDDLTVFRAAMLYERHAPHMFLPGSGVPEGFDDAG